MGGLNPIDQIVWWVILSVIVVFVVTFVVLRKVYFVPYIDVMEKRELELEEAESVLAEAGRVVAEAQPEAERITSEAREKADELLRRAREDDESYRTATVDAAMAAAATVLEKGRARTAEKREGELALLRVQAIECVTLACDRLLGSSQPESVAAAVDKLLARRVH